MTYIRSLWLYSEGDEYIQQIRNGRQSTLRTMGEGSQHYTGAGDTTKVKKFGKAQWLSEEASDNSWEKKRSEAKEKRKDMPNWMQSSRG